MFSESDAMHRALDLAWQGWGRVQPNPLVGAVVLREGQVIAEGWHVEFGEQHAEAMALFEAGDLAQDATLVVTLEPCRHQGKQPPCTEIIRAAGIRRVVMGSTDPNPLAGGGAKELVALGIEVEIGADLFRRAVRRQNAAFFHSFGENALRPFIALKLAMSVDGRIADRAGRSRWISGKEARAFVHWLRAGFDAIAVGGHTARMDDPELTVRGEVIPRVPPTRIVFSRSGDLEAATKLRATVSQVPVLVIGDRIPIARRRELEEAGIEVLDLGVGLLGPLAALRERGMTSILVEGGGRVATELLQAGLIDRFYWIQSPFWLGEGSVPAFAGLPDVALPEVWSWQVVQRRALGSDTLLVLDRNPGG